MACQDLQHPDLLQRLLHWSPTSPCQVSLRQQPGQRSLIVDATMHLRLKHEQKEHRLPRLQEQQSYCLQEQNRKKRQALRCLHQPERRRA